VNNRTNPTLNSDNRLMESTENQNVPSYDASHLKWLSPIHVPSNDRFVVVIFTYFSSQ